MADFQSSLTAAQIETVLTGAVLHNVATNLSDAAKAQARENIGATAAGQGIRIISHFASLAALQEAVPSPEAGDAYSVGAASPYSLYIWDALKSKWQDYGPIRSTDITARFAQNVTVPAVAWTHDATVFADYPYKATISLAEVTANDFPVVVFAPSDAAGGNFCPVAYTFDGVVQVFARAAPAAAITIPAITFIVQST